MTVNETIDPNWFKVTICRSNYDAFEWCFNNCVFEEWNLSTQQYQYTDLFFKHTEDAVAFKLIYGKLIVG